MFRSVEAALRVAVVTGLFAAVAGSAPALAEEAPSDRRYIIAAPKSGEPAKLPVLDVEASALPLRLSVARPDESVIDSRTANRRELTLAADVLFEFDEAELSNEARNRLQQVAQAIRKTAEGAVHVDGYTDSKGSTSYNRKLSKQRAQAVESELTQLLQGAQVTFVVRGHGEADPVAPNRVDGKDNPEGRAKNRRVEVSFRTS